MATTSSTPSAKPTIVFGPGAWHMARCFDTIRASLQAKGWETEAVEYPSVVEADKHAEALNRGDVDAKGLPGLDADAAATRDVLRRLCDEGKEVVLVVHSYGGLVGANALGAPADWNAPGGSTQPASEVEKFGLRHRQAAGQPGGVILYVYLAAFVTPKGGSIYNMLGGNWLPWMLPRGDVVVADKPVQTFYHDCAPAVQERAVANLCLQSKQVFLDSVGYEPWNDGVECAFYFCDQDKALPPPIQVQLAAQLGPDAVTYHANTSHSPFLSEVDEVCTFLADATKVGQERARKLL
ncbi:hypothetical protein PG993_003669 [Apiospora rasikravindrae]|uniref:AB hydrolase-1 domain-containing protein n=1 Tax=Apiospora rasikravindrae TaxID=990691 RepID=A0ABR1U075_9PEZI